MITVLLYSSVAKDFVRMTREDLIAAGLLVEDGLTPTPGRVPTLTLDLWAQKEIQRSLKDYHKNGPFWSDERGHRPDVDPDRDFR